MFALQAQDKQEEDERRLAEEDLALTLRVPHGYRTILRLLQSLGAAGPVDAEPGIVALRNQAEALLDEAARIEPAAYLRLMADLRRVPALLERE